METYLIEKLETLGYPVYLQGCAPDEYPETFITFLTIDSPDSAHFENVAVGTTWMFQVTIYSSDPEAIITGRTKIRETLKAAGFVPQGKGRDIPSDELTHTGWTTDYYYLEMEDF